MGSGSLEEIMKVYIVLAYNKDICKVVEVFGERKAAEKRANRLTRQIEDVNISYHVIEKEVIGSHDEEVYTDSGKIKITYMRGQKNGFR